MEVLTEAPSTGSFTLLAEHQSATPASFYNGPAVLHYYSDRCKLVLLDSEADRAPALANLVSKASTAHAPEGKSNGTEPPPQGLNGTQEGEEKTIEDIDVWVTSDKLFVYSSRAQTGISIPYPNISLHAIQTLPQPVPNDAISQGLYMQIINASPGGNFGEEEADDLDSISITIVPTASAAPISSDATQEDNVDEAVETEAIPESTPVQAMFAALSNCSNLHPDPVQDGDEENGAAMGFEGDFEGSEFLRAGLLQMGVNDGSGGLPPPMPGSGGWITAENMHEYFNENGEWIGPSNEADEDMEDVEETDGIGPNATNESQPLGPGAGHVRRAEDGTSGDTEDTKWRRTE